MTYATFADESGMHLLRIEVKGVSPYLCTYTTPGDARRRLIAFKLRETLHARLLAGVKDESCKKEYTPPDTYSTHDLLERVKLSSEPEAFHRDILQMRQITACEVYKK